MGKEVVNSLDEVSDVLLTRGARDNVLQSSPVQLEGLSVRERATGIEIQAGTLVVGASKKQKTKFGVVQPVDIRVLSHPTG